jgi:hypothetical protein
MVGKYFFGLFNVRRCTFFQEEQIGVAALDMTKITPLH